eukprot:CAMPEP_0170541396 /NCGR_PEP_ID=MMETSP0211-20121228/1140_1 /TAXON_ID=311385 /ORGANISM="Pseudokeronopsis sp., Strain OXSARD2" /LENGTH=110 /DNA_ID=CAMNT_0010844105 /DNA_START=451 /DNA_END=783 /DNA_ORIENTATION=-
MKTQQEASFFYNLKNKREKQEKEETYAYLLFSGYLSNFDVEDSLLQDIYNEASLYAKNFWFGIEFIFRGGERMDKNFRAAFLLRQVSFTVKNAIQTLYRKGDDLFDKKEF